MYYICKKIHIKIYLFAYVKFVNVCSLLLALQVPFYFFLIIKYIRWNLRSDINQNVMTPRAKYNVMPLFKYKINFQ